MTTTACDHKIIGEPSTMYLGKCRVCGYSGNEDCRDKDCWLWGVLKLPHTTIQDECLHHQPYLGETGKLYKVAYRYKSTDGWLKRKLVDLWLWIRRER